MNPNKPKNSAAQEEECPPLKIYLQWHGDGEPCNPEEVRDSDVTWCRDQVFTSDVEYRRIIVKAKRRKAK